MSRNAVGIGVGGVVSLQGRSLAAGGGGGGGGSWTYVNGVLVHPTGALSGTTLNLPTTALASGGNIFVFIRYEAATTATSVTDTAGNVYTALAEVASASGIVLGRWFYCLNATGHAANVVTITWAAARTFKWGCSFQFSKTGAVLDTSASGIVDSAISVTSSAITTGAPRLVLAGRGVYNQQSATTFSGGGTFIEPFQGLDPPGNDTMNFGSAAYLITSAPLSGQAITETGISTTHRALSVAVFN